MKKYNFSVEEKSVLEGLSQPLAVYQFIDKKIVTILLSDSFCDFFGYKDKDSAIYSMDNNMYEYVHVDDVARIADAAIYFATQDTVYDVIYRIRKIGKVDYMIVHAKGYHVYREDGTRLAYVWYSYEGQYDTEMGNHDFVLNKVFSNALHGESIIRENQYDYLTGLPNMTYFFELADVEKQKIQESNEDAVILYIDFGGMKFFNEKYGFAEGDNVLRSFARLLASEFLDSNVCRIGADHFAVITEGKDLESKIKHLLTEFSDVHNGKIPPVHVGVYPYRIEDVSISMACDRAKLACVTLKGVYSSGINYYNTKLYEAVVMRQYVVENLDRAISEKWIQVYLQPIVRTVNERVCDVEALARWVDPEKGILSPVSFIPALEDAGLIYKLDLYMLEQILESIKRERDEGFSILPHSLNISRMDFDACDIVEEIRKRVDAAGIAHDRITIELTESVIGSDFDFMSGQIKRFQDLGFPVWMDDFGSGYSSLDILQSIKFDLLKFDMSFMRKFDEGEDGRVVLTELMRMATSLGVNTVCEGVETDEQVRFLKEIGCSKLQGYYYSKPISFDTIREFRKNHMLIENENPAESGYYESIGKINLFDLGVIAKEDVNVLQNTFSTIPIAIIEVNDERIRYVRSNHSYHEFAKRFLGIDIPNGQIEFCHSFLGDNFGFFPMIEKCRNTENRIFFSMETPSGFMIHSFIRKVNVNPVTGGIAIVIAILSVSELDEHTTYADIAKSLAADYYNIFVIDLDTNQYIEYSSQVGGDELLVENHGEDFFESARKDAFVRIYKDDRESFLSVFTKENVLRELDVQGVFTITYRLIDTGTPMYVNMKITRLQNSNRIILGVSIIDSQMKQQEEEKKLRHEKAALGRIAALSPDYIVLYTVDVSTGHYIQYNPSDQFASFGLDMQGDDFFADVVADAPKAIAPEDMERHLRVFTKENILHDIEEKGFFVHNYGLILDGKVVPVSLRATFARENDKQMIVLGVSKVRKDDMMSISSNSSEEYMALLQENVQLRKEAVVMKRIAELKESLASLLINMPGLTFSKNMATGKYLACNQAFAEYANKKTPDEVVGFTDYELFDKETAEHFVADDKKAFAMNEPYVFFEDVLDGAGNRKQFQTTKLKFLDSNGRECLLGLCQDITETIRYQQENVLTKEAYKEV